MKKLILFLAALGCALSPLAAGNDEYSEYKIASYILESDFDKAAPLIKKVPADQKNHLNHFFWIAAEVCHPKATSLIHNTDSGSFPSMWTKCDKAKNEKILNLLLDLQQGSDVFAIAEKQDPKTDIISFELVTPLTHLKAGNPQALRTLLPKMDKCTIALTQMQADQPNDTSYGRSADFWRNAGCSVSKIKRAGKYVEKKNYNNTSELGITWLSDAWTKPDDWSNEKDFFDLVYEIGTSREQLISTHGNPTFYEHPYDFREIFTYRRMLKRDVINYKVADYIYTLDRGIVTHVQYKLIKAPIYYGDLATKDVTADQFKQKGY
jgi:hypothetical protein